MVRKRSNSQRVHPWAHLEEHFQVVIAGQRTPELRKTLAYHHALNTILGAVCATGAKIFDSWRMRDPWLGGEEVTQEWFIAMLVSGFLSCDPALKFYPLGYVIFLGHCSNYGRRERLRAGKALSEHWVADKLSAVGLLESEELRRFVRRAVDCLPICLRDAVSSQYFDGLSAADAAAIYQTTPSVINQRRFRGRQKLESLLGEFMADDIADRRKIA